MTSSTIHARDFRNTDNGVSLLSLAELVTWLGCIGVGIAGFLIPYPRPKPPTAPPVPMVAEIVHVQLTNDQSPPPPDITPQQSPTADVPQPPAPPAVGAVPTAPPLAAVAPLTSPSSPAIAFAQPVPGPTQTVDAKQAVPTRTPPAATQTSAPPSNQSSQPQHLVFGQGEARQPAPDYPLEAAQAHQQGKVVIRFIVAENGKVQSAQATVPCPFPLLNQAAVRAVRENWRFHPGPVRNYEVTITFQLK